MLLEAQLIPVEPARLTPLRQEFVARTGLGTDAYKITPRSPWPSELLALHLLGAQYGVRAWVESGTYHGQMMEVLARANPDAVALTVEADPAVAVVARDRLRWLEPRVRVFDGDGCQVVPKLVDGLTGPVGVFLDGPKSLDAFQLARRLMEQFPKVAFVGMHDMSQSIPGRAVVARAAIEELGQWEAGLDWWATDDPEYVAWARNLDEGLHDRHFSESSGSGWIPYHLVLHGGARPSRSYGPTIACLLREEGLPWRQAKHPPHP